MENQLFPSTVGAGGDKAPYEAEEENEQLSPVSILDAPFTEDQEEEEADDGDGDGDGCLHEFEHSLATVQSTYTRFNSSFHFFLLLLFVCVCPLWHGIVYRLQSPQYHMHCTCATTHAMCWRRYKAGAYVSMVPPRVCMSYCHHS